MPSTTTICDMRHACANPYARGARVTLTLAPGGTPLTCCSSCAAVLLATRSATDQAIAELQAVQS